jgi:hypothetical protein
MWVKEGDYNVCTGWVTVLVRGQLARVRVVASLLIFDVEYMKKKVK